MADTKPRTQMSAEDIKKAGEMTPEDAQKIFENKIARVAQVLDRGVLNDKLQQIIENCVPKGRRGKFVRDREEDIIRYTNLGFTFEVKEGAKGLHASGDGRVRVGDVVLMTISEEDYAVLQELRRRRVVQKVGEAKREYMNVASARSAEGVVPFDESVTITG